MFYLLPLVFSRSAKQSAIAAGRIVAATAAIVFIVITVLFPIGAGLVGPIRLADYLLAIGFYVLPSLAVLVLWVGMITLLGTHRK
jgi:hypothetical protein